MTEAVVGEEAEDVEDACNAPSKEIALEEPSVVSYGPRCGEGPREEGPQVASKEGLDGEGVEEGGELGWDEVRGGGVVEGAEYLADSGAGGGGERVGGIEGDDGRNTGGAGDEEVGEEAGDGGRVAMKCLVIPDLELAITGVEGVGGVPGSEPRGVELGTGDSVGSGADEAEVLDKDCLELSFFGGVLEGGEGDGEELVFVGEEAVADAGGEGRVELGSGEPAGKAGSGLPCLPVA